MAGLKDADDFKSGEFFKGAETLKRICLLGGIIGLIIFLGLAYQSAGSERTGAMAYSWLFAVTFFVTLAIGGLFWTLLHHATNSGWGTVVRRLMENLGSMIPFMLILGLPLILPAFGFRDALWEWFPERKAALEESARKAQEEKGAFVEKERSETAAAQSEYEAAKKKLAARKNLTPGHKQYFEDVIAGLERHAKTLAARDLTEGSVVKELEDHHFSEVNHGLYKKRGYLNETFWYVRYVVFLTVLGGMMFLLRRWSLKQDQDGDPGWFRLMRRWSCGFLPFFGVAWTFLVFDWLMALDYTWYSTMWGVYLFSGAALSSMSLLVIVLTLLRKSGYLKNVVTMEHYFLMGRLMLTFTIFWAYIAFSQFFLIWYANITEETKFFLSRNTAYWNTYAIAFLVMGHFFIPFVVLLFQKVKRVPIFLCAVALWNLFMHLLDIYWITIPERGPSLTRHAEKLLMVIPGAWIYDVLAFLTVGFIFGYLLLRQLGAASLYPCRDPRLDESLNVSG